MPEYFMPDWLLKMGEESGLVEESPQQPVQNKFRAERAAQELQRQRQQRMLADDLTDLVPQTDLIASPSPEPGTLREYEPANPTPPSPSPIGPPLSAPDVVTPAILAAREQLPMPEDSPENDDLDPQQTLQWLSESLGLPRKVVATLAMLGDEVSRIEEADRMAGLPVPGGPRGVTQPTQPPMPMEDPMDMPQQAQGPQPYPGELPPPQTPEQF
jgi:hypothetical protein